MNDNPTYKLLSTIKDYLDNRISIDKFCYDYEQIYSFEIDEDLLESYLKSDLKKLSGIVSRYSPYEEDLKHYDCYYSGEFIRSFVLNFSRKVNLQHVISNLNA